VLLVIGRDVVTMNARREIIRDGAVAIDGTRVEAVGKAAELRARFPDATLLGDDDAVVTPGFVNAHQHLTGDRLIRSAIPDDLPPGASIFEWAVPVHAQHSGDDDELSATLSCVEQVGNGITTVVEAGTVAHPERVAAALRRVGLRGAVGMWGWDVGDGPFATRASEVIARQRALVEELRDDDRVDGWVTLVGHDLMSDELLRAASDLARELRTRLTFHISPSPADAAAYQSRVGTRPLVHFERLGVLGDHVLLAHAVHLDDDECEAMLRTGAAIAYTPWAYLRLGQGVGANGRHAELHRRGVRIALGCDSENASDALDPLRTAALAAGIAKDQSLDPTVFGAHDAFEMLTIRGADAIGMADRIGSLEPGKQADVVVHDTSGAHWIPRSVDPVLQLVWASDGRSVRDVVVDGRVVVRDGRCTTVDLDALRADAADAAARLLQRAAVDPRSRWPVR
jgi:5-methylthioadenosine/S-adenosylhomocysteine deaminase